MKREEFNTERREKRLLELQNRHRHLHDLLDLELEKCGGIVLREREGFLDWMLSELYALNLNIDSLRGLQDAA